MTERVIALVDMDAFYCQVERRFNPELNDVPMAVVQYNQWKLGGIIAISYEAKDRGVKRGMRGEEAKSICPEIVLVPVPTVREKADLTRYRDAGREVLSVLCKFSDVVQRASVDEAFIDLTLAVEKKMNDALVTPNDLKSTFIVGYSDKSNDEDGRAGGLEHWLDEVLNGGLNDLAAQKLAYGAMIVEEMRQAVFDTTGFKCSAGIAHNKVLAKLACGIHKPNRQTVVPQSSVADLFATLPLCKIRSLGGKFGEEIGEKLNCRYMGDLLKYTEKELKEKFDDKNGSWLYNMARGYDNEAVESRLVSKSIGCCKKFPGRVALGSRKEVEHWVGKLAEELLERLLEDETMNKRKAQQMVVSVAVEINKKDVSSSKTVLLPAYNHEKIVALAMGYLKKVCSEDSTTLAWSPPIKFLGLSSGKFSQVGSKTINSFFKAEKTQCAKVSNDNLDESGSPSFFEKIFLKDTEKERPKLSLLPLLGKSETDSDDSNPSWAENLEEISTDKENIYNEPEKSDCVKINLKDKNKKKVHTIDNFLKVKKDNIDDFDPREMFPDLNSIDDDILSLLPFNYRKKVLLLKNQLPSTSNINEAFSNENDSSGSTPPQVQVDVEINEDVDLKMCEECFKMISVFKFEEHTDFHVAKKLQKELNGMSAVTPVVRNPANKSPKKQPLVKRKSNEKQSNNKSKKSKSIDQFYKK